MKRLRAYFWAWIACAACFEMGGLRIGASLPDDELKLRAFVTEAILCEDLDEQAALVAAMKPYASLPLTHLLNRWKEGEFVVLEAEGDVREVLYYTSEEDEDGLCSANRLLDDTPYSGAGTTKGKVDTFDAESADTTSAIRIAMNEIQDLVSLSDPDPSKRSAAVYEMGLSQDPEKQTLLKERESMEKDRHVLKTIEQASAFIQLRHGTPEEKISACNWLGNHKALFARDAMQGMIKESTASGDQALLAAATGALRKMESHLRVVNAAGTVFRGLSLGSILLISALGLAITFGLMGVINMAHGEMIAVGAYTTYVVQCVFDTGLSLSPFGLDFHIPGLNASGGWFDAYFVIALPLSFIIAALVGIGLERCVIRFLYRRPLESLLATWGVSLVLQQLFRMIFGANNVQVSSPAWLSGNWTVMDIIFGWNRVFVIGFAILIIVLVWLALNKTSLGLLIRSVMQNRGMAACMGVRTSRVNMLTFGLGSGLAGLAGAFLSQLGNVGPSLGQSYIIDSFMTVVAGGVGSLAGTVCSALGIGLFDQSLQQILGNPVMGKILVLVAIILFLQWRPSGLFSIRSRSLDD